MSAVQVPNTEMRVIGERMGGTEFPHCWREVRLVVRDGVVARREPLGPVSVQGARLMFCDLAGLEQWEEDAAADGLADVAFWGLHDAEIQELFGGTELSDGTVGWSNLPVEEAMALALKLQSHREAGHHRFAFDYRPHSHPYDLLGQIRASKTESGTLKMADALLCGFMTTWGDGFYPLERRLDDGGDLLEVAVVFATEQAMAAMRAVNP